MRVARTPEAQRQRHSDRILAAVQTQQRALHPQGQHRPQAAGQMRKLGLQQVPDVNTMQQVDAWPHSGAVVLVK